MKILVDIGNSRCKSAIEDSDGIHPLETFAWRGIFLNEVLEDIWLKNFGNRRPESIYVSNVAGDGLLPNLTAWCCSELEKAPIEIYSQAEFQGLSNGYQEPEKLGVDRWAAIIGARAQYSGALCVVDSGTAATVDLINAEGQHLGGAILPGIYTMRRSLGKYASALFAADGAISPFSNNTASAIAGGTGFASVGAIDRLVSEAKERVGPLTTVFTGGESEILESLTQHKVVRDPLLVLRGVSAVGQALEINQPGKYANGCQGITGV